MIALLVVGSTYAYSSVKHRLNKKSAAPIVNLGSDSNEAKTKKNTEELQAKNSAQTTTDSTPQSPSAQADATAALQEQCKSLISSFDGYMDSLDKQYYDAQDKWFDLVMKQGETQDLTEDKQWYKDYFHKKYSDNVSSTSPTATKLCGYDPGLQYRHPEPDYSAW